MLLRSGRFNSFFSVAFPLWCAGLCFLQTANSKEDAVDDGFKSKVQPFLTRYCIDCHGKDIAEAEFTVHNIDGRITDGKDTVRWEKILELVGLGHMPPEGAEQPAKIERNRITGWIGGELRKIGRGVNESQLALPSQANRVDHDELFSGKHKGPAYTPARIWRISPHIYKRFAGAMRTEISQPLHGMGGKGIQDYANLLADESTIQTMLRNCNLVADKLMYENRAPLNHLFKKGAVPNQKDIDRAIERLFEMIYQRKPTKEDRDRFIEGLFQKNVEAAGLEIAMRSLVVAMLMSQEFVFRLELGMGKKLPDGRRMLSPMELAYAISFAFYDQPDKELISLARDGRLSTREDVERVVRSVLNREDQKRQFFHYPMYHRWGADYYSHHPRILRFFREFFGYASAADVFKDQSRNPDHHARRLRKDADFLVLQILEKDQDVLAELLTTNRYPMDPLHENQIEKALEDKNNRFYKGLREKFGDEKFESILRSGLWPGLQSRHVTAYNLAYEKAEAVRRRTGQPVEFPENERAGILTHPAWLVAHSGNFDNDPIRRGKWIRERLLAELVPDVPIGVDAKIPDDPHRTLRERLDVVRPSECWRCHKLMNPLGEAFESYDDFGQFRTEIVIGDADAYRKEKRKYEETSRRFQKELLRWLSLEANVRAVKVAEAEQKLAKLIKPDNSVKNYTAALRRYENDLKRWTGEKEKWANMTDADQMQQVKKMRERIAALKEPVPETKPVNANGELRGTGDPNLDGPVRDAIDLVHRLAKSDRVRQSFVRHAFRFWMGRNETLDDSPTLMAADRAYVQSGGSFKELMVALMTSDSFLYRKEHDRSKNMKTSRPD